MNESAAAAFRQLFMILAGVVIVALFSVLPGCASPKAGPHPPPTALPSAASSQGAPTPVPATERTT